MRNLVHLLLRRVLAIGTDPSSTTDLRISYVDDPERPMRLVRAVGAMNPTSIDGLFGSWAHLTTPHRVHLDVTDVDIADAATMRRLESALDHLERQRIDVRVVGIDPTHPALAH